MTANADPELSGYSVGEKLGEGRFGVVYAARDLALRRDAAIKFFEHLTAGDQDLRPEFLREARVAARVNHPAICTIYRVGVVEAGGFTAGDGRRIGAGTPFVAMELVPFSPLEERLTGNESVTELQATEVSLQVAEALADAHSRGVVHGHLTAGSVMLLPSGRIKILDFGLPSRQSARDDAPDPSEDVLLLGRLMRRMAVAATLPANYLELAADCCCTEMAGRPSLDDVVERLREIHGELEARNCTSEMAQDLRSYPQGGVIRARRVGMHRRAWKFIRRHPTFVVAALVIAAGSAVAWRAGERKEARRLVADARLALREGVDRQGLEMVDRAIALDPGSIEARLVRAKLLIFDRTRDAAEEAREVLERDPDNVTAHAILAGGALALSSALRLVSIDPGPHIEAVEAAAPDGVEARYLKAMSTRDPAERVELLERVLDLDPGNRLALGNLLRTL